MKNNLFKLGGATLAATLGLWSSASLGQVTITETETVNPPVIEEHTTTTTTTPSVTVEDPVILDDRVYDLDDRMEAREEVRDEINDAREERAEELEDELEDLD